MCSQVAAAGAPEPLRMLLQKIERLRRLKEEIQGLRRDVRSLCGLVESSMTDQGRVSTWMISYMTQAHGGRKIYQAFDGTFLVLLGNFEWYEALKDSDLKEEALRNKAIMEGLINEDDESNNEDDEERCELFDNTTQELPVCTVRRFEMIKYSFGQDEEYVSVKEDEYEDLTSTSEDACRAYQEIFRMMDEGWMVTRAE
ncbi:hypothetical protein Tco_1000983 [Tanacetum coccineum]